MKETNWKDPSSYINKVYVDESCMDFAYTREILDRTKLPFTVVPEREQPNDLALDFAANLTRGKRQLFLTKNRGQFFKPCPGTKEYRCCDYQILNTGSNCPIDCVYCILQAYLNTPWLTHYVNLDVLFNELDTALGTNQQIMHRIGTGEFTDSLAIDRLTGLSRLLVERIAGYDNAVLELKTKSAVIENLKDLDHNGKTIIAWSLNSPEIMRSHELRSATLSQRLEAAALCAGWGYKLAFHFDPIIDYPGWQKGYVDTITQLYDSVPPESIVWISLGCLRYLPSLKETGVKRFPASRIYFNEFVVGLDNKQRYFRPRRVQMYSLLYETLKKKAASNTCIYFCMESDEIWKEVTGFRTEEKGGLPQMLNDAVKGAQ
ncbi:SPL family radical SAM protein [Desulforhopalus singaporensis]|uniref:Spore photoproduct lyase n=1 Tax=Desulforhopalus singaporensis TaxID=91360 RepID=A0A1H0PGW0_9BACT|nr:DNA photolyase [Desulforhopalus singaporensis]SDP04253.1 spore photoproduct lyase [Desulforhopalus singaporensis]